MSIFGETSDKRPLRLIDTKTIGNGLRPPDLLAPKLKSPEHAPSSPKLTTPVGTSPVRSHRIRTRPSLRADPVSQRIQQQEIVSDGQFLAVYDKPRDDIRTHLIAHYREVHVRSAKQLFPLRGYTVSGTSYDYVIARRTT